MNDNKDHRGLGSCDDCIHSYFNGTDYICGHGPSKYYGMGILSKNKECCEHYEYVDKGRKKWYG